MANQDHGDIVAVAELLAEVPEGGNWRTHYLLALLIVRLNDTRNAIISLENLVAGAINSSKGE